MTENSQEYTVLIVDDDEEVVELYEQWLSDVYDIRTAADGEDAMSALDDVDVALLDRRLPGLSGDDVAAEIARRDENCMTAMVTGVEPDVDILQISCGEYLVKPVDRDQLIETIERLRKRARYDDRLAECAALAAKRGAIEAAHHEAELQTNQEYKDLCAEINRLLDELDDMVQEFDGTDFLAAFSTPDFTGSARVQTVSWPN